MPTKGPKFQFWRGERSNLPALDDGEACWTTDTHEFFIGQDGQNWPVGAAGAVALEDGDYGDIAVSSSGTVFTIDNDAVTTAKLGGDITTAGKELLDDANAAAQRTTLGLGTAAVESAAAFDAAGTAAAAIVAHEAAGNPHPVYLTAAEGDAAYAALSHAHAGSDITSGAVALARGGTGASLSDPGANRLLGWDDATNAIVFWSPGGAPITMLPDLTLGFVNGTYGDITVSGDGATWTIVAASVTYAKMQDVSAAERLLGRGAGGGSGDVQEITAGTGLAFSGASLTCTVTAPAAASAAEQEAGTEAAKYVAPATQHRHLSAAKAIAVFTIAAGTPTLQTAHSYNVSSITDNGAGDYTVNFTTSFSSAHYGVVVTVEPDAGNNNVFGGVQNAGKATGSVRVRVYKYDFTTLGDPDSVTVVCFGDQ